MPKVSIITRTKNRPALLERTLLSIREQTFTDWEWVLVDSGDMPLGAAVTDFLATEPDRTRRIEAAPDLLMGAISNIGVRAASSPYVVLLDDDDTWQPEFLASTVARMEARIDPLCAGVVTRSRQIFESADGDGGWEVDEVKNLNMNLESIDLLSIAAYNRFTIHAFLYERAAFDGVGGYREDLPVLDDWDFNMRFLLAHDIDVIPEPLANWHIRTDETGGAGSNSLVSGKAKHLYYRSAIINGYLREEIESGKPGLGQIFAAASAARMLEPKIDQLQRKLMATSRKIGRIDVRTKALKDKLAGDRK